MGNIKTFSLSKHSRLFSVEDGNSDYLLVRTESHPFLEEPYRSESYAIAYLKTGSIHLQAGLTSHLLQAPALVTLAPSVFEHSSWI